MRGFRLPFLSGPEAERVEVTAPSVTFLVGSDDEREALLAWARRHLPAGDCLVEAKSLVGARRAFVTTPLDARAELVAESVPKLVRGSLLVRSRWYRVPADALLAEEAHYERGEPSHRYEIRLRPVATGEKPAPGAKVPA